MKRVPVEKPVHLRRMPPGQVAVRLTHAAANCVLSHQAGWHRIPNRLAATWLRFCREYSQSRRATGLPPDDDPYTAAEKCAMRALGNQIEAVLGRAK